MGIETVEQVVLAPMPPVQGSTDRSKSMHHQTMRLFETLLGRWYPEGHVSRPALLETRRPDIVWQIHETTVLFDVKVTPDCELFPPDDYIDVTEQVAAARVYPKEEWMLVTNYSLTDHMVERLEHRGLRTFSFELGDPVVAVEKRFGESMAEFFGPAVT